MQRIFTGGNFAVDVSSRRAPSKTRALFTGEHVSMKFCGLYKLLPQQVPCAIGAVISMPSHTPFTVVNMHGPFIRHECRALDASLEDLSHIGLLLGDFNDTISLSPV